MWLAFGIGAIVCMVLNLIWANQKKDPKWFRFASLAFTSLTVCAFYADAASRVLKEDWGGLMDVVPTSSKTLWVCVLVSIILNSITLFQDKKK